jgi:diaminopimelate decarboxylase
MELINGRYTIDGVDVLDLCQAHGLPLYVYELAKVERQYARLMAAFARTETKILYACKALTNLSVMRFLKSLGSGLDCVSIQEVWLGLRAGFGPSDIWYTPNCVSLEEIKMAVELGVHINIDNISILEQFGNLYGDKVPVCVRINPHIFAGGNPKISVGHIDSKFGISIYQVRHLERVIHTTKLRVEGLHMHTGSDIRDVDAFLRGANLLLETALTSFPDLKYIDFGSGFKVPYKTDDISTDIEQLGRKMSERFNDFCAQYGRPLTMMFEPGKFLVSEAGYFFARTNVIKQTTAAVFAGIDSGLNHLIRPMFYDAYHHIVNVSNPEAVERVYTVVGYICETDTFGWDRRLNEVREGDVLGFLNAGAYGFSMASNYNSRFRPAEVAIYKGKAWRIRERETLDDLLQGQHLLDIKSEG